MGRAFSLLEVTVTLAMLAVIASLAVPSLLPQVQKAQLSTSVDAIAAFVAATRDAAMSQRRCTRVVIVGDDVLVAHVRNGLSCEDVDDNVAPATLLDPTQPAWVELHSTLRLESPRLVAKFVSPQAASLPQLRFRPTGRVWANDAFVEDDNVLFEVTHPVLNETRQVLVKSNGFICAPASPIAASADPISYRCGGEP